MVELHPHDMAHGGEAVARRDGKAHFVAGAMPGEVIEATIFEDKGSWARAALVNVIEASPDRRIPPCPHADACGGCQWQFAEPTVQRAWKRSTVISQLEHLGRIEEPVVHDTLAPGPDLGYRNRVDFHVTDGRPSLMRARSNDALAIDACLLLDPSLQPLFDALGDLTGVDRITLRGGIRTGDVVVIVEGAMPAHAHTWGVPVAVRTDDGVEAVIGDPILTETVAGVTFSIPPDGFFQNNTQGADALVELVTMAAGITEGDTLLDAYCGVGLFGATVGADADLVLGIDTSTLAIEHAKRNLSSGGIRHKLVAGSLAHDIEAFDAYWDVAIVDPPRKGLGARAIDAITSAMPRRIVYVSCDPASLARDARTLTDAGYTFVDATPVDMFPQTYHVEVVATFDRAAPSGTAT
jgi:23S rRNA (uracil1939-C5)-methyltransferase